MKQNEKIRVVVTSQNIHRYAKQYTGCLILSHDGRIILQQRGQGWQRFPGLVSTFGGRIEHGETADDAITRELNEELGADVIKAHLHSLGMITESITNHLELIHTYFWHDIANTINCCTEGQIVYFNDSKAVLDNPSVMDDVRWIITVCKRKKFIK